MCFCVLHLETAKTGAALIKVKELLRHGEYLPWIEENMPVNYRQCAKYMKLATKNPSLLSNVNSNSHLDIDSELKLLALDDNDQSDEIRATAAEIQLDLDLGPIGLKISENALINVRGKLLNTDNYYYLYYLSALIAVLKKL